MNAMSQLDTIFTKERLDYLYKRYSPWTSEEFQRLLAKYLSGVKVEELDKPEYLGKLDLGYAWDDERQRYQVDLIKQTVQNGYYKVLGGYNLRAFNQIVLTVMPQLPITLLPEITNYIKVSRIQGEVEIEIMKQRPQLAVDYLIGVSYYLEYLIEANKRNYGTTPRYNWSKRRVLEGITTRNNFVQAKLVNKRVPTRDELDALNMYIQMGDSSKVNIAYRVMMMERLLTEDDAYYNYDAIYNVLESDDGDPNFYLIYIIQGYLSMDGGDLFYLERIINECIDIEGLTPYKDKILPYLLAELGPYLNTGRELPKYLKRIVNRLYVECGWHDELAPYIN